MSQSRRFKMPALLAALALLVSTGALAARHALLIGVSDYQEARSGEVPPAQPSRRLHDLPGATKDVALVKEVLQSRLGFQPTEIRTLLDREATHTGMRRAFAELAATVQPGDFVYIHYSGHGSLIKDYNDKERSGRDQTLVGYGARREGSQGLDRYDIPDDELNQWLAPIADKAGELVVVADSCHSASNTRGATALVSRAAPPDDQESHPYARAALQLHPLTGAVRIGAARDDESAYERQQADGSQVGLFTWQWAAALGQAEPTDTWRRVFERASLGVAIERGAAQHPQMTGERADRQILGGKLDPRPAAMVTKVRGENAILDAGRLAGVTVGSLYAASAADDAPRVRIDKTGDTWSSGRIEFGALNKGDFLVERQHAYATTPVALFAFPVEDTGDEPLAEAIRARLGKLTGFIWAHDPQQADLLLALVRPKRADGVPQFRDTPEGRETWPSRDPDAAPEVWIMNLGQRLLHRDLAVRLEPAEKGLEVLATNLERYRRTKELHRLIAEAGGTTGVKLGLIAYDGCEGPGPGCLRLPEVGTWHRRGGGTLPIERLSDRAWPEGTLLSFALENASRRDRYVYLLELAPNGAVRPLFPPAGQSPEVARIEAGRTLELPDADVGLLLDAPGEAYLLVLTTQYPIDPRFLTQEGYERYRGASAAGVHEGLDPLEQLLMDAVQGTATRTGVSIAPGAWGGALVGYRVEARKG